MNKDKLDFLLNTFPSLLKGLDPSTKGLWGKMNVQQMIEHMSDSLREANGKLNKSIITPPDKLPAMKDFMLSEKEFRPNTKNSLMPEEPSPTRNASIEDAIAELQAELNDFEKYYNSNTESKNASPFFGELNYAEWVHLLHKHATHHLKQFGAL